MMNQPDIAPNQPDTPLGSGSGPTQPEPMFNARWWRYVIAFGLLVFGSAALFVNFGLIGFFGLELDLSRLIPEDLTINSARFNYWALWFLIPIFFSTMRLLSALFNSNRPPVDVGRQVSTILFMSVLFGFFFFGLSWGKFWPLFFIFGGFLRFFRSSGQRRWRGWGGW